MLSTAYAYCTTLMCVDLGTRKASSQKSMSVKGRRVHCVLPWSGHMCNLPSLSNSWYYWEYEFGNTEGYNPCMPESTRNTKKHYFMLCRRSCIYLTGGCAIDKEMLPQQGWSNYFGLIVQIRGRTRQIF